MNKTFRFTPKKTDTLRNQIYQDIKDAVIQGNLRPGQRLREADLSEEMGVSRGPIREAILLLERDGLLVTQTYKETTVATLEEGEVEELLIPLRITLESYCIKKILPHLNETHFARLETIFSELRDACRNNDLAGVVKKDLEFHEYIVSIAEKPYLISLWNGISSRIVFHFMANSRVHQQNQFARFVEEHRTLLDALKTKDWSVVEPELRKHIY